MSFASKALIQIGAFFIRVFNFYRKSLVLRLGLCFVVLFLMFFLVGMSRYDPDFGWHLQTGYYISAHGIPSHDLYTYTAQTYRWIDHEWGNDVIVSQLFGWGGYALVSVIYASLWSGALLLAGGLKSRLNVLIIAALALNSYAGSRTLAWSTFFFALVLAILRSGNKRLRWALPLIFIVWPNLHAGFIAGLALILYFALVEKKLRTYLLFLVSACATLINAYGPRIYVEIAHTLFDPKLHSQISEWSSLYIPNTAILFIVLWGSAYVMGRPNARNNFSASYIERFHANLKAQLSLKPLLHTKPSLKKLFSRSSWHKLIYWFGLSPLLLLAALSATRNLPLFIIGAVREIDNGLSGFKTALPKKLNKASKIFIGAMLLAYIFAVSATAIKAFLPYSTDREAAYPVKAVAYLKQYPCSGNLFNSYNFGGYLIWKLPGTKIYIDGRMPTWRYYMDRYLNIDSTYQEQFKQYDIKCALILNYDTTTNGLKDSLIGQGWTTLVKDNTSVLLEDKSN